MGTKVFINLPVADLPRSKAFFQALGFSFNPHFTDDNAACMVISDENFAMLLKHAYFSTFTPKEIPDAHKSAQVLIALGFEDRAKVDAVAEAALANGGTAGATQDHGFMYMRQFSDLDGHTWEASWMDPAAVPQ